MTALRPPCIAGKWKTFDNGIFIAEPKGTADICNPTSFQTTLTIKQNGLFVSMINNDKIEDEIIGGWNPIFNQRTGKIDSWQVYAVRQQENKVIILSVSKKVKGKAVELRGFFLKQGFSETIPVPEQRPAIVVSRIVRA